MEMKIDEQHKQSFTVKQDENLVVLFNCFLATHMGKLVEWVGKI